MPRMHPAQNREFKRHTNAEADQKGFYYPACCEDQSLPRVSIPLNKGERFPRCPRHDTPVIWRLYQAVDE